MATLREVYDAIHTDAAVGADITMTNAAGSTLPIAGSTLPIFGRCHFSFDTNTRYVSYYVDNARDLRSVCLSILKDPLLACQLAAKGFEGRLSNPLRGIPPRSTETLIFAGRVYLYLDTLVSDALRNELHMAGARWGLSVEIRDARWLEAYNMGSRPLAFLSHDSRDKDGVARPLVGKLSRLLCPVWYDEYSLKVGDSLSESIDRGIRDAPKCILILSPNFLSNPGWGKAEFTAIMNRHIEQGAVILPVWHHVTRDDVYKYSSFLVDIFASNTARGLDRVARDISMVLKPPARA